MTDNNECITIYSTKFSSKVKDITLVSAVMKLRVP